MLTLLSIFFSKYLLYSVHNNKANSLRNLAWAPVIATLIFALFLTGFSAIAQQPPPGVFFVPRLPEQVLQKQPQLLKQINTEILKVKKTVQVYLILDQYLNTYPRTSVAVLRFADKENLERYSYWSGPRANGSSDFSKVTAAKALESDRIYERYQFENFFRDTIVVLDSIKLKILSQDVKIGTNSIFQGSNGSPVRQELRKNKELLLSLADQAHAGQYLTTNYQLTGSVKLACTFYFLSELDKTELFGVIGNLKENPSGVKPLSPDQVQLALRSYIRERFGPAKGWDIDKITDL